MTALQGKVAFVTGASSGIGAAVAQRLLSDGVKLGLASRTRPSFATGDCVVARCDVSNLSEVEAAVSSTVERFGGLNIVVANAGVGSWGAFLDAPLEELEEMIAINIRGLFHTVRATLPHLQRGGGGDLVAVASEAGRRGLPD